MARPKYRISTDDAWYAYEWLKKTHPSDELTIWMQGWVNEDGDRNTMASLLHAYADERLDESAWTRLKNAIRRRKVNEGSDLVSTRLPKDVVALINQIVTLDEQCKTQAEALQKHLKPVLDSLKEAEQARLHGYWLDEFSTWPVLELAAYSLKLAKWNTIHGRGLASELDTIAPKKDVFVRLLANIKLPEQNPLLDEFNNEQGKWIGLAKRKWSVLK